MPDKPTLPTDHEASLAIVRAAGRSLVASLQVSERATNGWTTGDVDQRVHAALDDCLSELERTGAHGMENRLLSSTLWTESGEYLRRGPLQVRAREKPRGYAGDYEMLRLICDNECCLEPLGGSFDRYFQAQAAPASCP